MPHLMSRLVLIWPLRPKEMTLHKKKIAGEVLFYSSFNPAAPVTCSIPETPPDHLYMHSWEIISFLLQKTPHDIS